MRRRFISPMRAAFLAALVLGTVGFIAGYFGAKFTSPHSNQGPLLALFVTGPLGFVLGFGGGWFWADGRNRKQQRTTAGDPPPQSLPRVE